MQLHLSAVVGRLLANHMLQVMLHVQWTGRSDLLRWWQCAHCLLLGCSARYLSGSTILLNKGPSDGRSYDLAGCNGHSIELVEARDQSRKPQGPVGLLRVQGVSRVSYSCKNIKGISHQLSHMNAHPLRMAYTS